MSKAIYIPENGTLIKHNKMYEVVNGQNHKILKGYIVEPVHYTILEYIESTGTQYIDTGFKPNQNTKVEAEYAWISGNSAVCGVRESNTGFLLYHESNLVYTMYGTTYASTGVTASANKATAVMDGVARIVTIGENSVSLASATFQMNYPMYLFGYSESGTADSKGSIRLYSCKIYDNGTLIRDYVPCKDTTGAVGLYDKVAGKFYTNAGTGTFTAGAETDVRHTKSVAKLFYSGNTGIRFSGSSELLQYTIDGNVYNVMRIKGTGVLSISGDDPVPVFLVGGGSGGCTPSDSFPAPIGGSGGFVFFGELAPADYNVLIGAGGAQNANGGDTVVTDADGAEVLKAEGGNFNGPGGSGGGGASDPANLATSSSMKLVAPQEGCNVSTVPFGITDLQPHSAGGGSGASKRYTNSNNLLGNGGDGGTNGNAGEAGSKYTGSNLNNAEEGVGGEKGGGTGGDFSGTNSTAVAATSATFYGSAGGAGASLFNNSTGKVSGSAGGRGYQGCMYLIWNEDGVLFEWEPFRIVTQPVGGTSPCLMTCEATGEGVTYQWQKGSTILGMTSWSDISGATSNTYEGTATSSWSATKYRCKVTDASGAVFYSDEVSVTK